MRRALLALALGLAPAAGNAAALIEIPEQNGLKMVEIWDVSGDGRVLVGGCSLASGGGSACRWREGQGLEALETPSGADALALGTSHDGSVVVGIRWAALTPFRAVRWDADGALDLGADLGADLGSGVAGGAGLAAGFFFADAAPAFDEAVLRGAADDFDADDFFAMALLAPDRARAVTSWRTNAEPLKDTLSAPSDCRNGPRRESDPTGTLPGVARRGAASALQGDPCRPVKRLD